jgi:hypothetical protein
MSQMALFLSVKVNVSYKEGADNIDINTETIDGKDTFHSMAMAVSLTDKNNAIWDINALFDADFLFQSNTCKEPSHL